MFCITIFKFNEFFSAHPLVYVYKYLYNINTLIDPDISFFFQLHTTSHLFCLKEIRIFFINNSLFENEEQKIAPISFSSHLLCVCKINLLESEQ